MAGTICRGSFYKLQGLGLQQSLIRTFSFSQSSMAKILQEPNLRFVPESNPVLESDIKTLADFVEKHKRIFVLTGAGMSTASGIPDYRSEGVGLYARGDKRPIQHGDFLKSEKNRQRYWARNYVGWPKFSSVLPNSGHKILSDWEKRKKISWLVTQNVDALHHKAGSRNVTELHGCSHRVECLQCGSGMMRHRLQELIADMNPHFHEESLDIAPDGDVQLSDYQVRSFQVPSCPSCGGVLQPQIVFFGANVAKPIVMFVFRKVEECDSVLVLGSSLEVYSGYRFVVAASKRELPIAIVNIGPTRAEDLATIKIRGQCMDVLERTDALLQERFKAS